MLAPSFAQAKLQFQAGVNTAVTGKFISYTGARASIKQGQNLYSVLYGALHDSDTEQAAGVSYRKYFYQKKYLTKFVLETGAFYAHNLDSTKPDNNVFLFLGFGTSWEVFDKINFVPGFTLSFMQAKPEEDSSWAIKDLFRRDYLEVDEKKQGSWVVVPSFVLELSVDI